MSCLESKFLSILWADYFISYFILDIAERSYLVFGSSWSEIVVSFSSSRFCFFISPNLVFLSAFGFDLSILMADFKYFLL